MRPLELELELDLEQLLGDSEDGDCDENNFLLLLLLSGVHIGLVVGFRALPSKFELVGRGVSGGNGLLSLLLVRLIP
jgi:hypothetical protein